MIDRRSAQSSFVPSGYDVECRLGDITHALICIALDAPP
jgi:hypothetical protein